MSYSRYDLVVNTHKIGFYRADFRYEVVATSILMVEDVKSPATKTAVYKLKSELRKGIVWNRDHRGVRITGLHCKRKIAMLTYKAELVGIKVKLTEESYTSKASFLDRDELPVYNPECKEKPRFSGKRMKRGLYCASGNRYINADVNGFYNIIRKGAPDAFGSKGVEDGKAVLASLVVHPVRLVVPRRNQKVKSRERYQTP